MKLKDIVRQGIRNLLRHRSRTFLTVLGVIVGCCSVVIMISIGIGMRLSTQTTLEKMGDLTMITVTAGENSSVKLDAAAVNQFRSISSVKAVVPRISYYGDVNLYAGSQDRYEASYVSLVGIDLNEAAREGYELKEGDWSKLKKGEVLVGEYLAYAFRDTKRPEGHNMVERYQYYDWETNSYPDLPDAYVDPVNETITLVLGSTGDGTSAKKVTAQLTAGGVLKENYNRGFETSEGILMDLDMLQKLIDDYASLTGGKKQSETGYNEVHVIVNNISDVETAEKEIRRMGFRTSSMDSIRKPMEQEMQQKQMLLGCVGAVALFVAALGIANTMIMSITERIREIGVMKALGCYLSDIRKMFLFEAGCIGLIGGMIGIGISYVISMVMNMAGTGAMFGNEYDYLIDSSSLDMSVIPWWLALFAVMFSIFIGVAAGLYPAEKAVRIPALEAIKHD